MSGARSAVISPEKLPHNLSVAALDRRLGLRRRAREDGARDQPPSSANELSPAEQAVLDALAPEYASLAGARETARLEAERRLRALAPSLQEFSTPAAEARLLLRQAAGRVAGDWRAASERAAEARREIQAFKAEHALRRPAIYPASPVLQAGLLLLAAVFESMFSAALFAEDDARGLLGGAVIAMGLSGANVTLGFLTGYLGLRYLQHRRPPLKCAGAMAFGAFTLLALMLNLYAADWRDRLAAAAGAIGADSDASFHLWTLLQLDSPQAIILLMLGAGVWMFAALKGYSGFDDPYPDYGKIDRAAASAAAEFSEVRAEARSQLENPINDARGALTGRLEQARAEFDVMAKAFDSAASRLESLNARIRALDTLAADAIELYRRENRASRTTPAPPYFDAAPRPAGAREDTLAYASSLIDDARTRLADAQRSAAEALSGLLADLEQAVAQLESGAPQ